ncbi:MAG: hypothetical protein V4578_04350 [Pseudomonadota bacterium]
MTATYHHIPLAQVAPGMVLSDELLDMQGHVLLPQGTVLTEAMLELMPRHGIAVLPIERPPISHDELAASRHHYQQRIDHLFRKHDPDHDADWATGLLRRYVSDFRLGMEDIPE